MELIDITMVLIAILLIAGIAVPYIFLYVILRAIWTMITTTSRNLYDSPRKTRIKKKYSRTNQPTGEDETV